MSQSKQALVRYHALDKCFSDFNRFYRIDDLVVAVNRAVSDFEGDLYKPDYVSKRTVQEDIKYMRRERPYNIPLEEIFDSLDKRRKYFRYNEPGFSIKKLPMSKQDLDLIRGAMETLRTFKGLPKFEWIEEASARIDSWTSESDDKPPVILFDNNIDMKGKEHIQPLYHAIRNKSPLAIEYHPFDKQKEVHQISPYVLKQFNNRWFVLCKSNQHNFLINLALDRIEKIHQGKHQFEEYPEGSPEEFFDEIVGVTRKDKSAEKVEILVRSDLYPYLATKPIHYSQKKIQAESDAKWMKITLNIIPNYEFYSVILSHCPRIRVIGPEKVKQDFMNIVRETYSQYF
ncbi:helix-turn-helix transcriptional regulator [Algoriphagus chordae]|uniref:Putative DNA-binding transcriptional regulator YafY n=1 Tax=Algoriphagus chordae TaxID=237019 RepID=A0A2W7R5R4_9BACT|nr:WYL domain-containing protein [Algoriphagus chordae]PZX45995.1 putative DNA-binding transcriptional regulator YafY [Algoriphagus chordae]